MIEKIIDNILNPFEKIANKYYDNYYIIYAIGIGFVLFIATFIYIIYIILK